MDKIKPVILCGGIGKRLRPLSSSLRAKQFISLFSIPSSFQQTIKRIENNALFSTPLFVTNQNQAKEVHAQASLVTVSENFSILTETSRKNTASAIIGTALYWKKCEHGNQPLLFLPSDHYIPNKEAFEKAINKGLSLLKKHPDCIICFGIKPRIAHTGYGYIQKGKDNTILSFTEKPNKKSAKEYIASDQYLWNSGIFLSTSGTLINEAKRHCPNILNGVQAQIDNKRINTDKTASLSFDVAIMEKSRNTKVIEADFIWSDLGGWKQLTAYLYSKLFKKDVSYNP